MNQYRFMGILKSMPGENFLQSYLSRVSQKRRILRFAENENFRVSFGDTLCDSLVRDFQSAYGMIDAGWLDGVIITSRSNFADENIDLSYIINLLESVGGTVIVLDETNRFRY